MPSACLGPIRPRIPDDVHDQDGEEAEQDHRQERPSGLQIDHRPGEPRPGNELAASKTKTSTTRKARTFDVLLPRLARAGEGLTFEGGDYVRLTGTVPAQLAAIRMTGSPLGVHAAAKGGDTSLCGVPSRRTGRRRQSSRRRAKQPRSPLQSHADFARHA